MILDDISHVMEFHGIMMIPFHIIFERNEYEVSIYGKVAVYKINTLGYTEFKEFSDVLRRKANTHSIRNRLMEDVSVLPKVIY